MSAARGATSVDQLDHETATRVALRGCPQLGLRSGGRAGQRRLRVMVDWADIEASYAELQKARREGGAAMLMRLSEMQMCLGEALDAQVMECVTVDNYSWQRVGDALGVTRQAASKRWTRRVPGHQ